jgi:type III pantothenate kinase
MSTTLCFDFGNTRLKCAVFKNREFAQLLVLENDEPATIATLLDQYQPQKTILSSVIKHHPELETILSQRSQFHLLDYRSKLPFTTPVGKPETIGADRLALVAAAVDLFPHQHNLIIALGSCITFNFVNKYDEFLGGAISPGMEMRFRSMNQYTALLPLIKATELHEDASFPLIGYDTKTNLISGVIMGMAKEIDGISAAYAEKYSNFNVLLTGGDMAFFVAHLKNKIFADPYLIYKGLYAISEHNQP